MGQKQFFALVCLTGLPCFSGFALSSASLKQSVLLSQGKLGCSQRSSSREDVPEGALLVKELLLLVSETDSGVDTDLKVNGENGCSQ